MNKIILYIVLLLCSTRVFAQFAIVNDKDGYVNVRSSPKIEQNNVIDTLHNGSFVYVYKDESERNWLYIKFKNNDNGGYIYLDKIKYISDYQNIPKVFMHKNNLTFRDNTVSIEIKIKKFDKSKHIITYTKDSEGETLMNKIDGKEFWGTDNVIPENEYESICVTMNKVKYFLPNKAINNLFEPDLDSTTVNYDTKNDVLYIQAQNSDGACVYNVVWKIEKGIYKKRWVFLDLYV